MCVFHLNYTHNEMSVQQLRDHTTISPLQSRYINIFLQLNEESKNKPYPIRKWIVFVLSIDACASHLSVTRRTRRRRGLRCDEDEGRTLQSPIMPLDEKKKKKEEKEEKGQVKNKIAYLICYYYTQN